MKNIKTLNNKIEVNETQYNLDKEISKTFALPSGFLDKYEFLAGHNLALKPGVIKQQQFKCSPLRQIFIKRTLESNIDNDNIDINRVW